ncbi:MAG: PBP1A family penicillin-binding protein [bacterium]|nr:MAG: PBP1A family penicillin-binding protein [bacterium]
MAGKKKKTTTALSLIAFILTAIGKPFYFIFSHIFIAVIFVFYFVGSSIRRIKLPKFPKIRSFALPKIKYNFLKNYTFPRFKISFKKRYLFIVLGITVITFITYLTIFKDLPSYKELMSRKIEVSTKIYDRNGVLLYTIYKDKNRTPVKLEEIPQSVILSTIAAEDAEFYYHKGFSLRGMFRALVKNISEGKLQGGSTITQQLVKNALLSSEKTYIRKVRELILSVMVEFNYSKDQILEMYLNEVSYGGTVYGIQEASKHYFNKDVKDLTLAESALLAGLPQSPTRYSPFGNNPDLTFSRQREVLYLMKINKFISEDQESEALEQRITFAPNKQDIKAPHFVMYVREKLIEEYGEEVVTTGGLTVTTTLDYDIQKIAEEAVRDEVSKIERLNVNNGAAVVLSPHNGEILAMVGSKNYFDTENDGNVNVTTRLRQPGSSIKVVTYTLALSSGFTLSTIIDDSAITFKVPGQKDYSPKNYDDLYKGKITIRQALAQSRNIPAVKILASLGVTKIIDLGEKMGITTWLDRSRFGLSLTLGGGETKLLDVAQAYSVIANGGVKNDLIYISEIVNYKDKTIYKRDEQSKSKNKLIIDSRVAYLLIDILKDNVSRSPAFGTNSKLVIPNHPEVAVKTGTSNDLKDNLTIGFNQDYLTAVWVGNNDSSSMSRIASGITGAAPIWNRIMTSLLMGKEAVEWAIPNGLIQKECYGRFEWYLEENQMNCPKIVDPAGMTEGPNIN